MNASHTSPQLLAFIIQGSILYALPSSIRYVNSWAVHQNDKGSLCGKYQHQYNMATASLCSVKSKCKPHNRRNNSKRCSWESCSYMSKCSSMTTAKKVHQNRVNKQTRHWRTNEKSEDAHTLVHSVSPHAIHAILKGPLPCNDDDGSDGGDGGRWRWRC